ncbi:MAG: DUF1501 domain-containing protein [Chitinophagaceae bacterium]|nr:DUF1501 domain-containing protein [Chitinophagaceae bacterium]MCW5926305.1 DUF1501 domain-containing protein [Chitinophagaceae bacterium]
MKRRDFLRNTVPAAILPSFINGESITALAPNSFLNAITNYAEETDHVLVIIEMNGGNDGLNMVIPRDTYSAYYNIRANIAIPEANVLRLQGNDKTGLHPAMTGVQQLFNDGKVAIVQSAGYPDPNLSHFRSTDIWMSASDSNEVVNTGWIGRYLASEYPGYPMGYPNAAMPDPPAIQIGSLSSLTFHGPNIGMAMSITNPTSFYRIVDDVQDPAPATRAGKELTYIREIARQTEKFGDSIKRAATNSTQQLPYPDNNGLANQLKIVARLIKGGLKTRVYKVSIGGFDTHSMQTEMSNPMTGKHAELLKELSDAVKAFQDDLAFLGLEDRVLAFTFSEFGRRINSNFSVGTDHGAAAPMLVFGSKVQPGIIGNNPHIPGAGTQSNIPHQYDYRSVYASILEKWFCADNLGLQTVLLKNFQSLPIIQDNACNTNIKPKDDTSLISNYPNPFTTTTTVRYITQGGHTLVQVIDCMGRVVKRLVDGNQTGNTYTITFDSTGLAAGIYYLRLQNGPLQQVRAILKVK